MWFHQVFCCSLSIQEMDEPAWEETKAIASAFSLCVTFQYVESNAREPCIVYCSADRAFSQRCHRSTNTGVPHNTKYEWILGCLIDWFISNVNVPGHWYTGISTSLVHRYIYLLDMACAALFSGTYTSIPPPSCHGVTTHLNERTSMRQRSVHTQNQSTYF